MITVWRKKSAAELAKLRNNMIAKHPLYGNLNPEPPQREPEREFASNLPSQFERRKFPYLSDKEFQKKKPKV